MPTDSTRNLGMDETADQTDRRDLVDPGSYRSSPA